MMNMNMNSKWLNKERGNLLFHMNNSGPGDIAAHYIVTNIRYKCGQCSNDVFRTVVLSVYLAWHFSPCWFHFHAAHSNEMDTAGPSLFPLSLSLEEENNHLFKIL